MGGGFLIKRVVPDGIGEKPPNFCDMCNIIIYNRDNCRQI